MKTRLLIIIGIVLTSIGSGTFAYYTQVQNQCESILGYLHNPLLGTWWGCYKYLQLIEHNSEPKLESDASENSTISENKKPHTLYDISGVKQIYRIGEPISFTETVQGYANPCVFPYYKILDANTLETVWQYKIVYPCPFIKDPQQFKIINTIPNDDILSPILNQTGHYILRSYHSYSDEYEDVTFSVIDESSGEQENEN